MSDNPFVARAIGALQVVGGGLEIALGIGAVAVPEPTTTAGGIIIIAHGGDTMIAGLRSLYHGNVKNSGTQQLAEYAARTAGASNSTAQIVGSGVDIAAGIGPAIAVQVSRRIVLSAAAPNSQPRVAIAYLKGNRNNPFGHNVVGVSQGGEIAWYHMARNRRPSRLHSFRGAPKPDSRYVVTELAVTPSQAFRADATKEGLELSGSATWRLTGPNCTTTACRVLENAGVVVPDWAVAPVLLSTGVRRGSEFTIYGGTAATASPAIAGGK